LPAQAVNSLGNLESRKTRTPFAEPGFEDLAK